MNYIDILLTKDGSFCVAPPWAVKVGDLVCVPDVLAGEMIREVIAVVTDEEDGDYVKMTEKYIGFPLPKIKGRYLKSEVVWDEDIQE